LNRGERGIWQRRFWEQTIRDKQDYASHLDYVHFDPVKHGFAQSAAAWPYSTFHRAIAKGNIQARGALKISTTTWRAKDQSK